MKGKISQWKDEMDFGFIQPDDGSEKLFFHISSIKTNARRPQVGDSVFYQSRYDSQQRLRAKKVVIEGIVNDALSIHHKQPIKTKVSTKHFTYYLSILVVLASFTVLGFEFYHTNTIQLTWPCIALIVITTTFLILSSRKKPADKSFNCSMCNELTQYDARTIQAWNDEVVNLLCASCHFQWLNDHPQ